MFVGLRLQPPMDSRLRRAPPVPHRRLVLLLLSEGVLVTDWRSFILGADLCQLLAATRTGSLILLFLGLPSSYDLPRVQRPIRAVLLAISAEAAADARRLRRLYLA